MALDAPRAVPPYEPQTINRMWWYCLHCRHQEITEYQTKAHVKTQHAGGDPDFEVAKGEDYTNGDHLHILIDRWREWSLTVADRFVLALDSLRGADDFELEVGEGLPGA